MMQFNHTRMFNQSLLVSLAISMSFVCLLSACKSPDNIELLEAQLRENEVVVQNYERELGAMNSQLAVAKREAKILREQLKRQGETVPAVEATTALAAIESLKFNTLLTAGQNQDSHPGDERFHAIVSPVDASGEVVKVLGEVELEAIDLSRPEGERTVGKWSYSAEDAINLWHSGYLSSGYRFALPWESLPSGNEVVLRITMKTPDGRDLAASHTLKIQPPTQLANSESPPQRVNPPESMKQADAKTDEKLETADLKPTRPSSVLDLKEPITAGEEEPPESEEPKGVAKIVPASFEKKQPLDKEILKDTDPRPFPKRVITSDTQSEFSFSITR